MLSSVAAVLFDLVLAGLWPLAVFHVAARRAADAAWLRPSAILSALLFVASAITSLFFGGAGSDLLRLAAALAMLAGAIALGRAGRLSPFAAVSDPPSPAGIPPAENPPPMRSLMAASGEESGRQTLRMLESALEGSSITISQQDRALRYTRVFNPLPGLPVLLGRTDAEILPAESLEEVHALKCGVMESGEPLDTEIRLAFDGVDHWFRLRLERDEQEQGGLICIAVDITAERENEKHLRALLRELTHRSRNLLAVIQGIARRTAATSEDVDSFVDRFGGRLQALAAAHDILIDSSWRGAPLRELVQVQLAHLGAGGAEQLDVQGEPLTLKPEAAQHLSLALHELAANAVEHGALSRPGGHVHLNWTDRPAVDQDPGSVEMVWREEGGPAVSGPERSGFGQVVLSRLVPRGLDGEATLEFPPGGLVWTLTFPRSNLIEADPA